MLQLTHLQRKQRVAAQVVAGCRIVPISVQRLVPLGAPAGVLEEVHPHRVEGVLLQHMRDSGQHPRVREA
eukprot:SAG31_NODE_2400_length_5775_cov_2.602185_5_plen_70_part_00